MQTYAHFVWTTSDGNSIPYRYKWPRNYFLPHVLVLHFNITSAKKLRAGEMFNYDYHFGITNVSFFANAKIIVTVYILLSSQKKTKYY